MHSLQHNNISNNFMSPEQMLGGLLNVGVGDCDCNEDTSEENHQPETLKNIETTISNLHHTLDSMNNEVVEVEGLLGQRDMLYHQLDHLRTEREQIEDEIQSQQYEVESTYQISNSKGIHEMNERLRRRIRQVKDYIEKMENENQKIEDVLMYDYQPPQSQFCKYTQYGGERAPTWMNKINDQFSTKTHSYSKLNEEYFDGLRKRLQNKQEEAWRRVKKQEEEIQNRNSRSLMNFGRSQFGMRSAYASPKYHRY